ncbi:MAG: energy-coupling factor transporter ATPase [Lachnospiraceae bacterium]|nr:energy-coupling factor transporter ATPase [Lachnospiraceae bacterium]
MLPVVTKGLVHDYVTRDEEGNASETKRALDHVDITVEEGQFIAVLGANGSGKSTLAKHINALLLPTDGTVLTCDMDTADDDYLWEIRKSAGMVFQNPDNQIVASVVEEDVGFGPENLGVPTEEILERVDECLKAVGMTKYRESSPNKLSGGQKQRVAIAGILAMQPRCILLDEPTAMLDPIGRREVLETVHRLNREKGITVLLITHYMEEVIDADRVLVMNKGHLVMQGTPREIFSRMDELKELRLEVPQVTELSQGLAKAGYDIGVALTPEEFADAYAGKFGGLHGAQAPAAAGNTAENAATAAQKPENDASEAKEAILTLRDVSYVYGAKTAFEKVAVDDVNLDIYPGEYIGLIGHTGSGKSTMIQLLNGLERPSEGSVCFEGEDIFGEKYNRRLLRYNVGLVFQYPDHQLFETTVFQDVCYGPKNQGLTGDELKARAEWALNLVGVDPSQWQTSPFELSGGQKRRVAIAGVLAMKPKVLVLDEPTAGLDPGGRDEILGEIDRIRRETGMTVVLVSHRMEDVARFADRLVVMNDGKILYAASPRVVFRHRRELTEVGLEVPQVTQVMQLLREKGLQVPGDLITTEEALAALIPAKQ